MAFFCSFTKTCFKTKEEIKPKRKPSLTGDAIALMPDLSSRGYGPAFSDATRTISTSEDPHDTLSTLEQPEWWINSLHKCQYNVTLEGKGASPNATPIADVRRSLCKHKTIELDLLLDSQFGTSCFMQFLVANLCAENLLFHQAVTDALNDSEGLCVDEIKHIYSQFIADNAPSMVSLSAAMQRSLADEMKLLETTDIISTRMVTLIRTADREAVRELADELFQRFMVHPSSEVWREKLNQAAQVNRALRPSRSVSHLTKSRSDGGLSVSSS